MTLKVASLFLAVAVFGCSPGDGGGRTNGDMDAGGSSVAACGASNCGGCCNGDRCETGTSQTLCGGAGSACVACDSGNACAAGQCKVADAGTPQPKRLFITRSYYDGDLKTAGGATSGLLGGDKLCQVAADSVNLGGTFKAWLSDETTAAIDRIAGNGPWVNMKGEVVFNNRATLALGPLKPILWDERGNNTTPQGSSWTNVWTGSNASGQLYNGPASGTFGSNVKGDCSGWSSSALNGVYGSYGMNNSTGTNWTEDYAADCHTQRPLYCFEQ